MKFDLHFMTLQFLLSSCRGFYDGLEQYLLQFAGGEERLSDLRREGDLKIRVEVAVSSVRYSIDDAFELDVEEEETVDSLWLRIWENDLMKRITDIEKSNPCSNSIESMKITVYVAYGIHVLFDVESGVNLDLLVDLVEGN